MTQASAFLEGGTVSLILRREEGQGLAEYALILSLIAILAVAALLFFSGRLDSMLSLIGSKV
jgi:Flp pilus assembly pilin Flp